MSEILVGIDATPSAEDALAFAQRLAAATGAGLRVATAFPYSDLHTRASNEAYREALRQDAEAMLDRVAGDLPRHVVADASPAHALHRLAEQTRAALVVVGSTHRSHIGRVLPGSTGERLLHGSPCPVAIVPRGYASHEGEIRTVGIGYDGFDESEAALTSARELARRLGARLRVIRVFDAAHDATPALVPGLDYVALEKQVEAVQRRELAERVDALDADAEAEAVFAAGRPGPTLAREATAVDVLVIGSRGYGPLRAVLLGGVSHAVVREAERPVIVLARGVQLGLGTLFAPTAQANA